MPRKSLYQPTKRQKQKRITFANTKRKLMEKKRFNESKQKYLSSLRKQKEQVSNLKFGSTRKISKSLKKNSKKGLSFLKSLDKVLTK